MIETSRPHRGRALIAGSLAILVVVAGAAPVMAKRGSDKGKKVHERVDERGRSEKAPRLKLRFKLHDHKLAAGEEVAGHVSVMQQVRGDRSPVAGASVSLRMGGEEMASLTTDEHGTAPVSVTVEEAGGHVLRAVLEDGGRGKSLQRSQGFRVMDEADDESDESDDDESDDDESDDTDDEADDDDADDAGDDELGDEAGE